MQTESEQGSNVDNGQTVGKTRAPSDNRPQRNWYRDSSAHRYVTQDPIGLEGGLNLYSYPVNPIRAVDPLGLVITVAPELQKALDVVKSSPEGKKLYDQLQNSPDRYSIKTISRCDGWAARQIDNTVFINPNLDVRQAMKDPNGKVSTQRMSLSRILAHEMGHLTGTKDDGPGQMANINKWENPIMKPIDGKTRMEYGEFAQNCDTPCPLK